ncbi:MAG: DNA-packaging protein [Nitrosopumilus sp.]
MAAPKGNKYALGCTTNGRPPIFESPEQLEEKCREYLEYCIKEKEKPTITGLTLYVGFCSRSSWDDYAKRKEYSYIVKRAKLTIQNSYEQSGGVFDIFALKNMGWKDKTEVDNTHTIKTTTIKWGDGEIKI